MPTEKQNIVTYCENLLNNFRDKKETKEDTYEKDSIFYEFNYTSFQNVTSLNMIVGICIIFGYIIKFAITLKLSPYCGLLEGIKNKDDLDEIIICDIIMLVAISFELFLLIFILKTSFKKISINTFMSKLMTTENDTENVKSSIKKKKISKCKDNYPTPASTNSTQLPSNYKFTENGSTIGISSSDTFNYN
ncbi:Hypothetical protein SRAE_1000236250 [Strongyloides ratti]|uniref:Uncharacterized protein n=1 Tax=Strongyloides ratti TaxID=34506 RepID=A0A090L318_STRRB|nr:Hypothetical protein SRAE_1000236250 [Strongyloides ratti]CEF64107.1 Hypothetical protein SRAE_1000236250 [Strongyloides ratti]